MGRSAGHTRSRRPTPSFRTHTERLRATEKRKALYLGLLFLCVQGCFIGRADEGLAVGSAGYPLRSKDMPDGIAYGFQFLVCRITPSKEAIFRISFVSWCMLVAHFYWNSIV